MDCNRISITIQDLVVHAKVGTTAEERAFPQRLLIRFELELTPPNDVQALVLDQSADWSAAAARVKAALLAREWELVEHATAAAAECILQAFPAVLTVHAEIRKFALSDAAWTGCRLTASRSGA